MFSADDFAEMADRLAAIEGAFVLSINATREMRDTFARFHVEDVSVTYTVSSSSGKRATELIVTNRKRPNLLVS